MFPHPEGFLLVYSTNQRYGGIPGFPTNFEWCLFRLFHFGDIASCHMVYDNASDVANGKH
jgi:hypothetical protein